MQTNQKVILGLVLASATGYLFVQGAKAKNTTDKLDFKLAGLRFGNIVALSPAFQVDLSIQNPSPDEAVIELNDINLTSNGRQIINGTASVNKITIPPNSTRKIENIEAKFSWLSVGSSLRDFLQKGTFTGVLQIIGSFNGINFTQNIPFKHSQQ